MALGDYTLATAVVPLSNFKEKSGMDAAIEDCDRVAAEAMAWRDARDRSRASIAAP